MRIGVYSDSLPNLGRSEMFAWCAERGILDIELGMGSWGPWPRPHLDFATIGNSKEKDRLVGELREHGLRLGARRHFRARDCLRHHPCDIRN